MRARNRNTFGDYSTQTCCAENRSRGILSTRADTEFIGFAAHRCGRHHRSIESGSVLQIWCVFSLYHPCTASIDQRVAVYITMPWHAVYSNADGSLVETTSQMSIKFLFSNANIAKFTHRSTNNFRLRYVCFAICLMCCASLRRDSRLTLSVYARAKANALRTSCNSCATTYSSH